MAFSPRGIVRSTVALLVVGFLALLGIVAMTFWLGQRAELYANATIAARDMRGAAVELRHSLEAAESSQRGYLVSGNQIYLAPYGTAKAGAERELDRLGQILATEAQSGPILARLSTIVTEKFGEMDDTIAAKRDRRDAEALAVFRTNRGKALMDEANVFLSGIIATADERLTTVVGEQTENAALLRLATILGGILIVFVVGVVTTTGVRYTREITAARRELATLNAGLEERVKKRTMDLALANNEIQRFAYIVTHDLRAPLVNIMGFTSELERGLKSMRTLIDRARPGPTESEAPSDAIAREAETAANVDLPEAIGFIRSSTKKMDSLINAILKLSREGARKLRAEPIELEGVIKASAATIQHQLAEAGGAISFDLAPLDLATDRLSLEQIVGNLLDNAVKYRSPSRPLRISVTTRPAPGGLVALEVADNGRGIAPQDRERVFELFRRAGAQNQTGEGIGLAHVRAVVRNLGGTIALSSELDVGTTFRIVLPARLQASESDVA